MGPVVKMEPAADGRRSVCGSNMPVRWPMEATPRPTRTADTKTSEFSFAEVTNEFRFRRRRDAVDGDDEECEEDGRDNKVEEYQFALQTNETNLPQKEDHKRPRPKHRRKRSIKQVQQRQQGLEKIYLSPLLKVVTYCCLLLFITMLSGGK